MPKITGRRYLPILDLGQITATVCATLHSRAHSRQPKPTARATQLKARSHHRSSTMHSSVNELLGSRHYLPPPSPCPQRFSLRTTPASHEVPHRGQGPSGRGSRSRNNATDSQTPSRPSACEQSPAAGARALDEGTCLHRAGASPPMSFAMEKVSRRVVGRRGCPYVK